MGPPSGPAARFNAPRLAAAILFIAGIALLVLTGVIERHQRKIFAGALHTTGTVVAMLPKHGSHGSVTYAPLVRYRTGTGVQVDFTSSSSSNPPDYQVGQNVPVVYPALNPQQAEIDSWMARWGQTAIVGGLAVAFVLLGGVGFVKNRG